MRARLRRDTFSHMKYTTIPTTINAWQYKEGCLSELPDHIRVRLSNDAFSASFEVYDKLHDTWVKFQDGDYIIEGLLKEHYPCTEEVFRRKYIRIEDD